MDLIPAHIARLSGDPLLAAVAEWLFTAVSQPDPSSKRDRPMCVRSSRALKIGRIHLVARNEPTAVESAFDQEISLIEAVFETSKPVEGEMLEAHSILFCYPHVNLAIFEAICAARKSDFIRRTLLLGKFHPDVQLHALDDATHWFLPCPLPILALRQLIPEDFRFLQRNRIISDRGELVEAYQEVFGDSLRP
jgi:hypothetical protein